MILVGQTGLDPVLRAEPGVELVRARTPVDAIGELADPIDPDENGSAIIIVDPRVEPAANGSGHSGDLAEFLEGLRRVDPSVRVLRLTRDDDDVPPGYDGRVSASADAETLRNTLVGTAPEPAGRLGPAEGSPVETIEPKPMSAAGHESPPTDTVGTHDELAMLAEVTAGRPVLGAALARLRARPGFADMEFIASDTGADRSARSSAPVRAGGVYVGQLCSNTLAPAALTPAAAWLGAWLELEQEQHRLRELAFRDPLTGAWNRRFFDDFLPKAIAEARQHRRAMTLLVFDIDDFKRFNDTHGHAAGDEILTECVRLLDSAVRPTDKVCRIGGDEFAVVFYEPEGPRQPDSSHPTSVFDIAERFRALVREARFRKLADDAPGQLTISGGLATFPWDGASAESLLDRADQLAIEGKRQGKNVIAIGPGCLRLGEE